MFFTVAIMVRILAGEVKFHNANLYIASALDTIYYWLCSQVKGCLEGVCVVALS